MEKVNLSEVTIGEQFTTLKETIANISYPVVSEYGDMSLRDMPLSHFWGDRPI